MAPIPIPRADATQTHSRLVVPVPPPDPAPSDRRHLPAAVYPPPSLLARCNMRHLALAPFRPVGHPPRRRRRRPIHTRLLHPVPRPRERRRRVFVVRTGALHPHGPYRARLLHLGLGSGHRARHGLVGRGRAPVRHSRLGAGGGRRGAPGVRRAGHIPPWATEAPEARTKGTSVRGRQREGHRGPDGWRCRRRRMEARATPRHAGPQGPGRRRALGRGRLAADLERRVGRQSPGLGRTDRRQRRDSRGSYPPLSTPSPSPPFLCPIPLHR